MLDVVVVEVVVDVVVDVVVVVVVLVVVVVEVVLVLLVVVVDVVVVLVLVDVVVESPLQGNWHPVYPSSFQPAAWSQMLPVPVLPSELLIVTSLTLFEHMMLLVSVLM